MRIFLAITVTLSSWRQQSIPYDKNIPCDKNIYLQANVPYDKNIYPRGPVIKISFFKQMCPMIKITIFMQMYPVLKIDFDTLNPKPLRMKTRCAHFKGMRNQI